MDLRGRTALLIGAGGAARAVAFGLRSRGANLLVANRTAAKAAELGTPVGFTRPELEEAAGTADLVVNCTSLGLHGDEVPPELPMDALADGRVVADVVYRGTGTPWLHAAQGRGARCVDGLGMLLHQGAAAFVQWTGVEPPVEVMRTALRG